MAARPSARSAAGEAGGYQQHAESVTAPWRQSRFWLVQLVVLALYLVRLAALVAFNVHETGWSAATAGAAVFLIPLVYAALNFGLLGAASTAGWVTVLFLPECVSLADAGEASGAWALVIQLAVIDGVALVVGRRVTDDRMARAAAERAEAAHEQAESLYRDLFESNLSPIVIVDGTGIVVELNAAARRMFRHPGPLGDHRAPASRDDSRLIDVVGAAAASTILADLVPDLRAAQRHEPSPEAMQTGPREPVAPVSFRTEGSEVLLRPTLTPLQHPIAGGVAQVVFEDVTAETLRREHVEAYAGQVVLGQEEERRHLAQELHDGPLQALIHLCRQIDGVDVADTGAAGVREQLDQLRVTTEATVDELRSIARGLRPSILDDLGLDASLRQMAAAAAARTGNIVEFTLTGPPRRLPPDTELALFRITQEAVSNSEKHAESSRTDVVLSFQVDEVRLTISDDGAGFTQADAERADLRGSLGLTGMAERAHLVGARLTVASAPDSGTRIEVVLPTDVAGGDPAERATVETTDGARRK